MRALLLVLLFLMAAPAALAHKPSDSYLSLSVAGNTVHGQWDIALRDLDFAIGLDSSGDGAISWGEVRSKHADIAAYALARLSVSSDGQQCQLAPIDHLIDTHTDGTYAVLRFEARCSRIGSTLALSYSLLFDVDPQHRGLLRLEYRNATSTGIFTPTANAQNFSLDGQSRLTQFSDYALQGIWHIWIGFDHILFLMALLLPAVWVRTQHRWQAVDAFFPALVAVTKIVTAFTLAHSITLSLATLGFVSLPSRWIESSIALSVIVAAINNVLPIFPERRWLMAFLFGLLHGFGFASVLSDLGLPAGANAIALLGFNLGVEAGQLAIVALFLPIAYFLRNTFFYRRVVFFSGSLLIALLASIWLVERAFEVRLISG